jgi:hypothetical protein
MALFCSGLCQLMSAPHVQDQIQYRRLPRFSAAEVETLRAYGIHALQQLRQRRQRPSSAAEPATPRDSFASQFLLPVAPLAEEAAIKAEYSLTCGLLLDVVGCNPARLLRCIFSGVERPPMTHAELLAAGDGARMPGAWQHHGF